MKDKIHSLLLKYGFTGFGEYVVIPVLIIITIILQF